MFFKKFKEFGHTAFRWGKYDSPVGGEFVCGWHAPCLEYDRAFGSGDCPEERYGMLIISIGWGKLYLHIPNNFKRTAEHNYEGPSYGFYLYPYNNKFIDSMWLRFGYKSKVILFPWSYEWVRTSYLQTDGNWINELDSVRKKARKKGEPYNAVDTDSPFIWRESYDYTYVLKSGKVQKRTAVIRVEEREWRPRWFKWTKLFAHTRRYIDVQFDDEVGEETGSWKGGVMGCGYEMNVIEATDQQTGHRVKRLETPEECLRRMEAERKF